METPRRIVKRIHLWLGLGLGMLMVLAGLTGALLVWYVEIDRMLHPELAAAGTAGPAAWDRAVPVVRAAFPQRQGPWRIEVTGQAGSLPLRYYDPAETAGHGHAPLMVWLSPDGTHILRQDFWGRYAATWVYDLHYHLQLGPVGGTVLGYAGIALALLLLSGLWAWWPRGTWAKALRFKRKAARSRKLRDWHKLAGLGGLPLLLLLTVTGVLLALPDETNRLLSPAFGAPQDTRAPPGRIGRGRDIAPSAAVVAAMRALPGARPVWIEAPGANAGSYRLRLQGAWDPSPRFPHGYVWIDRETGAVLKVSSVAGGSPLTVLGAWLHPLHDGSAGGPILRMLVTLAGLVPPLLFWTGWQRWRIRKRQAACAKTALRPSGPTKNAAPLRGRRF